MRWRRNNLYANSARALEDRMSYNEFSGISFSDSY